MHAKALFLGCVPAKSVEHDGPPPNEDDCMDAIKFMRRPWRSTATYITQPFSACVQACMLAGMCGTSHPFSHSSIQPASPPACQSACVMPVCLPQIALRLFTRTSRQTALHQTLSLPLESGPTTRPLLEF